MRGQAHTIFSYLAWAVFFVVVVGIVYYIYQHTGERLPTPMPTILDTLQSAKNLSMAGGNEEVCNFIFIGSTIKLMKEILERRLDMDVQFSCEAPGCEVVGDGMRISGRGKICAKVEGGVLKVVWRR